ncbi:DUF4349 domain-containing protein [Nocardioides sediminis]|uniref:DUF4349 domain-containing protein n=1 Tax=Nocardioides sediminis TaxID=433648 RepID=UPI00131EE0ED|nr:DUF4349 domain-containing protein [Nocardioides sediminis]
MTTHAPTPRRRTRTGRLVGLLTTLATAILMTAVLAACSSSDTSSSDAGGAEASYGSGDDGAASEVAPSEAGDAEGGGEPSAAQDRDTGTSSGGATPGARNRPPVAAERHIISTGTVSLTSDDVREARRDVQRVVDASGGDVTEEQTDTDEEGEAVYARLVVRVPAGSFSEAMTALEKVGDLRGSDRSSEDVSTQVIDTDVRVRAQEASLRRVEELLARARGLRDIIWIESQLTTRQAELDSLKQQQAWLADQTRDSTIVVDISRTPEEEEKDEEAEGFLAGFSGGMEALGAVAVGLATVAGALLPFAVVLLVLGLPVWLVVRRAARRRRTPQAPPPAAA